MGKRIAALVLSVCMALPLFGCGGRIEAQCLTDGITAQTIDTRTDLTDDSSAVMDFAAALLRQTAGKEGVLLSPVSLLYALGMTANGASGETSAKPLSGRFFGESAARLQTSCAASARRSG